MLITLYIIQYIIVNHSYILKIASGNIFSHCLTLILEGLFWESTCTPLADYCIFIHIFDILNFLSKAALKSTNAQNILFYYFLLNVYQL